MVLQELAVRVSDTEIMGLALYDGVRVVTRILADSPSLMLIGTRSHEPDVEGLIGFVHAVEHGVGAVDAIEAAIEAGQNLVDLRQVCRPASPAELEAMHAAAAEPPPGAARMTPAQASAFIAGRGGDPAAQGLPSERPTPPQGGTAVVRPQPRPVVARPVPQPKGGQP